jgi:thioredoxin reductase (NADPH)
MSRYLIRRIEDTPNIALLPHLEIVVLDGGDHLERVVWRNNQTCHTEKENMAHISQ